MNKEESHGYIRKLEDRIRDLELENSGLRKTFRSQNTSSGPTSRKNELEDQLSFFRNITQYLTGVILMVNARGIITYASPSVELLLGYHPSDVIMKPAADFIHPEDIAAVSEQFNTFLSRKNTAEGMELRIRHATGNWVYLGISGNKYIQTNTAGGVIFTASEITHHKQLEQLFEKYQHKLEALVHERTKELAQKNEELAVRNSELNATNEHLFRTNEELDRINQMMREESDKRVTMQRLLEESENKFRSFLEKSFEGIVLMNENGEIVEWNQTLSSILGIPREQAIKLHVWDIDYKLSQSNDEPLPDYDLIQERVHSNIKEILGHMVIRHTERWQNLPSGQKRYLQMTVFPFETQNGKFIGRIVNDITEKKKAEEELSTYQAQLEELIQTRTKELFKKEELIRFIENSISYSFGETFFENIVLNISKVLNADVVVVGEFSENSDFIKTIAICENGKVSENTRYPVNGSPCKNILNHKACLHRENVQQEFPQDPFLKKYNIEAFIGVPLYDSKGIPAGLMMSMFRSPLKEKDPIGVSILQIFTSRVGVEIERKHIIQNLKTSEEKFRSVVENIPIGIAISNFDNELLYANSKLEELFGYKFQSVRNNEEWIKMAYPDPEYFLATDRQWKEDIKQVLSGQISRAPVREHKIRCLDGTFRDVEVSFSVSGNLFLTIFHDITQRKQAEQLVIDSEQKITNIFNSISDAIVISDFDRNILQVNKSVANMMQYSLEEFLSHPITSYIAPEFHSMMDERLVLIRKGFVPGEVEIDVIKRDGSLLTVELDSRSIHHEGKPALLTIIRDISERKLIERKLFETIIQTEEKEREKFAANLHDEIGPILSSLKMYLSSLAESDDSSKKDRLIPIIQNLITEAIATIRDISNDLSPSLLNRSGLEKALSAYLHFKSEFIHITFDQNIEGLRFNPNLEVVLYRIVKELVNNTIKHAEAQKVFISILHDNGQIKLIYTDDGKGFELDQILDQSLTSGMGLMNIISRAKTINSKFQIITSVKKGFKFELSAPWQ